MEERKKEYRRYRATAVFMLLLLAVVLMCNISFGSVKVPLTEIIKSITGRGAQEIYSSIIWKIRLPRIFASMILGGALAVSGFLLQTFFHNPIAGPFILGISSGAKMAVAAVMVFAAAAGTFVNAGAMIAAAWAGSMVSMGIVLLFAKRTNRMSQLIVTGVMIGYLCSAVTDFVITFGDEYNIANLHSWSVGSFSGMTWENVLAMTIVVFPAAAAAFFLAKPIGGYQLGEVYAQNMGVNIRRLRIWLILLSSILSACVTAFAGPVSFVGIAVPHLVRSALKTSRPIAVIPMCFIGGSVFCLGCDLIARTLLAPQELSISSVTGVLGAPIVISIMLKRNKKSE